MDVVGSIDALREAEPVQDASREKSEFRGLILPVSHSVTLTFLFSPLISRYSSFIFVAVSKDENTPNKSNLQGKGLF